MGFIHIIVLVWIAVFLFAIYFIARIHTKSPAIGQKQDFITEFVGKKENYLRRERIHMKIGTYLKFLVICPLVIGVLAFIATSNGLLAVLTGALGLLVPEGIIRYMKYDRNRKFEERYARSLEQLSSSLRAGLSIAQAVEDVANCKFVHESIRHKYEKLSSDLRMGETVTEAFKRFAEGSNSQDAEDVALAIDVQNVVGGHEADVIKEIASDIRERIMLRREIRSIFSSTSSMVWMMDFIAPGIVLYFLFVNQDYVALYFSNPFYVALFLVFVVMIIIGIIVNHAILNKVKKGA